MPSHGTALDSVRVEVAFSADPNTATPTFTNLTSRARLDRGIDITRGRSDEFDAVQPGRCMVTFDNTDGALTPGRVSSPFYPYVRPQNRLRVSSLVTPGNLLAAEDASFEGGTVGGWQAGGLPGPGSLSNSTTRAYVGTRSLLATWHTGSFARAYLDVPLSIGTTYAASAYVWVPTGSPAVSLCVSDPYTQSAASTVFDGWQRLSITFVATAATAQVYVTVGLASTTAGQQAWIDGVMLEDGTSTPGTFTAAPPVFERRYDGYVEEWPVEWPTGGQQESTTTVTALDMQSRMGRVRKIGSVVEETMRTLTPDWYFPLDEPSGSQSAGDRIGSSSTLTKTQLGTGGTLDFGSGTGAGTDGSSAPMFSPESPGNGLYLSGGYMLLSSAVELHAAALSTVATTAQTIARWGDSWGVYVEVGFDATGHTVARFRTSWSPSTNLTVTSANIDADGRTHEVGASLVLSGGTLTLRLYVDDVERGTAASVAYPGTTVPYLALITVGGSSADVFTGTISHVAGWNRALTAPERTERYESVITGFSGERSDERIARIASWVGIPAGLLDLDVGVATIGSPDSTDRSAWDYMQDVATTEGGILFVSTDGRLTLYSRSRLSDVGAAVDVSVPADVVDPSTRLVHSLSGVVNDLTVTRTGGASARVVDAASVSAYGILSESVNVISDTDEDAYSRAQWLLSLRSTPRTRLPELTLDGLTEPSTAAAVRALDIWSRVQVTGMPSQSPESTFDLRVQGYTERIGRGGWTVTANTTTFLQFVPFILDDPTYGLLDEGNRLTY